VQQASVKTRDEKFGLQHRTGVLVDHKLMRSVFISVAAT